MSSDEEDIYNDIAVPLAESSIEKTKENIIQRQNTKSTPTITVTKKEYAANTDGTDKSEENSVYVGEVDYTVTEKELYDHFTACGRINRVTILKTKAGHPKGFAYIEFFDAIGAETALQLDETEFKGRKLKVKLKRVNIPKFQRGRRGRGGFRGRGRKTY